jgi:hypothetical protein
MILILQIFEYLSALAKIEKNSLTFINKTNIQ